MTRNKCTSLRLSLCLSVRPSACYFVISVRPSVRPFVRPSACLSVVLSNYLPHSFPTSLIFSLSLSMSQQENSTRFSLQKLQNQI